MANMNQNASVNVSVNGQEAKKELENLEVIAKGLRKQLADAYNANDTRGIKKADAELKKVQKSMANIRRESFNVNEVMSRLDKATPKELRKTLAQINRELNSGKVERGSKAWNEYQQKAHAVREELRGINTEQKAATSLIERMGGAVKGFFTSTVGKVAMGAGMLISAKEIEDNFLKVSESYAGVIKYTGLTTEATKAMNEEYRKLDTRTPREKLNVFAMDAGRLGIQVKDDILDFVETANTIDLAFGDDLDGAVKQFGKMAEKFGEIERIGLKDAMLGTASAVNELAQSSSASESYIVDYTSRLTSTATAAKIAQTDIMGYASALDQSMVSLEKSATAMQKLLMLMPRDPGKFAKIIGVTKDEFSKMFNEDANATVLKFFEAMQKLGTLDKIAPVLKDLKLTDAGASDMIMALAGSLDKVREAQKLATEAYEEGTSVIEEANIVNNTEQAQIEKKMNLLRDESLLLGEKLLPIRLASIDAMTKAVQVIKLMLGFYSENRKLINALVIAIVAYNAALFISNSYTKIATVANKGLHASQLLVAATWNLLTGNITRAKAAMVSFNAVVKINPWHAAMAGILALSAGVVLLAKRTTFAQKTHAKYLAEIGKEKTMLDELVKRFNAAEKGSRQYNSIRDEIQSKYGEYLKNVGLEADGIYKNAKAYSTLAKEVENAAAARVKDSLIAEAAEDMTKSVADKFADIRKRVIDKQGAIGVDNFDKIKEYIDAQDLTNISHKDTKALFESLNLNSSDFNKEINAILSYQYNFQKKIEEFNALIKTNPRSTNQGGSTPDSQDRSTPGTADDSTLKEKEKALEAWYAKEKAMQATQYLIGKQTKLEYDEGMLELEMLFLEKKKALYEAGSKEFEELEAQIGLKKIEARKKENEQSAELVKEAYELDKQLLQQAFIDGRISYSSYQQQLLDVELSYLQKMASMHVVGSKERTNFEKQAEDLLQKDKLKKAEQFENSKKQLYQEFSKQSITDMYNLDMQALEALHRDKLLSEKEYLEAKKRLEKDYTQATTDNFLDTDEGRALVDRTQFALASIQTIVGAFNNLTNAQADAEIAKIDQKYEGEIKAAGRNQRKVKEIEEKKQKEIAAVKSKYADRAFAMQMAMGMAQTLQGAISAYTSTAAIPIIGPGMAPVAAGIAMAAGMLNMAAMAKQQQAAKKGYAKGGYTPSGAWDDEQGVVHSNEFVANRFATNNPAVRPVLDLIDTAQRNNTIASITTQDIVGSVAYRGSATKGDNSVIIGRDSSHVGVPTQSSQGVKELLEKLSARLDDPFVTINTVDGQYGIKKAMDDYTRQEKNKAR